jgi:hypothetical protein
MRDARRPANGGDGWGGGAFVGAGGSAFIQQTNIVANLAIGGLAGSGGSGGGGLYVASGVKVTVKKSHVVGNLASTSNDDIYGIVTYV